MDTEPSRNRNIDNPGEFNETSNCKKEIQPPVGQFANSEGVKKRNPGSEELAWLHQQRDVPTALRQPLLDMVLKNLGDKSARGECRRIFLNCGNDENRFVQSIEKKLERYSRKLGVGLSIEQVLAMESNLRRPGRFEQRQLPEQRLQKIESVLLYNTKPKV